VPAARLLMIPVRPEPAASVWPAVVGRVDAGTLGRRGLEVADLACARIAAKTLSDGGSPWVWTFHRAAISRSIPHRLAGAMGKPEATRARCMGSACSHDSFAHR
jgi:hypothetical protein